MRVDRRILVLSAATLAACLAPIAEADTGLTVDLEPENPHATGTPGATVEFVLVVRNPTATNQTYNLNVTVVPPGWDASLNATSMNVSGLSNRTLSLRIQVPPDAADAASTISVRAQNAAVPDSDSINATVSVESPATAEPTRSSTPSPEATTDPSEASEAVRARDADRRGSDPEDWLLTPAPLLRGPGAEATALGAAGWAPAPVPIPGPARLVAAATLGPLASWGLVGEAIRYRLRALVLAAFTRLRRDEVLDHDLRARLHAAIASGPGVGYGALRRSFGIRNGQLTHHLSVLERAGLVRVARVGRRCLFYTGPTRVFAPDSLADEIASLVTARPGLRQQELARELGISKQLASYHLSALERRGRVYIERVGRVAQCWPGRAADSVAKAGTRRRL